MHIYNPYLRLCDEYSQYLGAVWYHLIWYNGNHSRSSASKGHHPLRWTGRGRMTDWASCLRYKNVCKIGMKQCSISMSSWGSLVWDRTSWRIKAKNGVPGGRDCKEQVLAERRARWKQGQSQPQQPSAVAPAKCQRDCHSLVGLFSHSRNCQWYSALNSPIGPRR